MAEKPAMSRTDKTKVLRVLHEEIIVYEMCKCDATELEIRCDEVTSINITCFRTTPCAIGKYSQQNLLFLIEGSIPGLQCHEESP